ncbi:hypothetical protein [Nocardia sp. NBC_01327]|uniref:hypothetical protein n=1 Tax=Nocardia sp. NBC_01327 TaxID=2903593 RepID=UPI002E12D8B1|nr:hypothetical protein OG326_26605 [Nocardia sp. NBC_01327]
MTPQEDFARVAAQLADFGVVVSTVFGKPAYKDVNGKAFACLFRDGLACRLVSGTEEHTAALAFPGAALFDPSDRHRPMKDWVVIPHADTAHWVTYAEAALHRPR